MAGNYNLRKHTKRRCTVVVDFEPDFTDNDLAKMAAWCEQNKCGRRTAYNMFAFRTRKEMMLFTLRWS